MTPSAPSAAAVRRLAAVGRGGDPAAVQATVAVLLLEATGAEQCHVLPVPLPAAGTRGAATAVAYRAGGGTPEVYAPGAGEAAAWVAAHGRPLVVDAERAAAGLGPEMSGRFGLAGALLLPFAVGDTPRAVVALGSSVPRGWPAHEIEVPAALLDVASLALSVAEVGALARQDRLTGTLNREAMRARLAEEVERARRNGTAVACLLLALEGLDEISARHGAPVADALLRHVAGVLNGQFRATDQVARVADETFCVVIADAPPPQADMAAQRALRLLRETRVRTESGEQELEVTMGLAEWRAPEGADELLARAESARRAGAPHGRGAPHQVAAQ